MYRQLVETLTDDALLDPVLRQAGWFEERGIPDTFEMLFAVTRSPGGFEGEATPRLLTSRPEPLAGRSGGS